MKKLGTLKEVKLRDIWAHEEYDFSAWLAEEENIKLLGDTLGLTLVDCEREKHVGPYTCDILCKDEYTNQIVLIENRLEPMDHDHLGKAIVYAAGLNASIIVWIVQNAKQEHAAAVEWLNSHTTNDVSFFLLEIHAYQIGDSVPAPAFKVIEQPNDYVKASIRNSKDDVTESDQKRRAFWLNFNEILEERGDFNVRKASSERWYAFHFGTSLCHFEINLLNREKKMRIQLWIPPENEHSKELFDSLITHKEDVETTIGHGLDWLRMDDSKACRICSYLGGFDLDNDSNWDELSNKALDELVLYRKAFKPYF